MPKAKETTLDRLLREIDQIIHLIRPALELAKIKPLMFKNREEASIIAAQEAYDYCKDIVTGAWKEWRDVWNLQSEERWNWYFLDQESYKGFPEDVRMQKALKGLRKALKMGSRPALLKHTEPKAKLFKDDPGIA